MQVDGVWRVVVVDDDPDVRSVLSSLLSADPDLTVVGHAEDGVAAGAVVARERPDVVLVDWQMPVLDGLEALPEIRARVPDAVIVLMSGSGPTELQEWAIRAGADGFYSKDIGMAKRLAKELKTLLAERSSC
jgi:DNA-binding NarL/FixJ family response regulator